MTALPRGRHSLSRAEVITAQRDRIVEATAEAMAAQGYVDTSVADILRRAGVSRETFYEQYSSKQDCFIATLDHIIDVLKTSMRDNAIATAGTPTQRLDAMLATYLDALATEPALARVFLIEVYAAGEAAMHRRLELQDQFAQVLAEIIGARSAADRFACTVVVAAISSLVTARIISNDVDGLRALRKPLMTLAARLFS